VIGSNEGDLVGRLPLTALQGKVFLDVFDGGLVLNHQVADLLTNQGRRRVTGQSVPEVRQGRGGLGLCIGHDASQEVQAAVGRVLGQALGNGCFGAGQIALGQGLEGSVDQGVGIDGVEAHAHTCSMN